MVRGELTEKQWQQLEPLLPPQSPETGQPNKDHRTIINGILLRQAQDRSGCYEPEHPGGIYPSATASGGP
jgi:hypothetical protein